MVHLFEELLLDLLTNLGRSHIPTPDKFAPHLIIHTSRPLKDPSRPDLAVIHVTTNCEYASIRIETYGMSEIRCSYYIGGNDLTPNLDEGTPRLLEYPDRALKSRDLGDMCM